MLAQTLHGDDMRSQSNSNEANIRKSADLLFRLQCSKAQKLLQLNGLRDYLDKVIVEQMTWKHPTRKTPISPLSDEKSQATRKGIGGKVLRYCIVKLKHDITP